MNTTELRLIDQVEWINQQTCDATYSVQESLINVYIKHAQILQESSISDDSCFDMILEGYELTKTDSTDTTDNKDSKKKSHKKSGFVRDYVNQKISLVVRILRIIRNIFHNILLIIRKCKYNKLYKELINLLKKNEITRVPTYHKDIEKTIFAITKIGQQLKTILEVGLMNAYTPGKINDNVIEKVQQIMSTFQSIKEFSDICTKDMNFEHSTPKQFLDFDCKYTCDIDELEYYFRMSNDVIANIEIVVNAFDLFIDDLIKRAEKMTEIKEKNDDTVNEYIKNMNYNEWRNSSQNLLTFATYLVRTDTLYFNALKILVEEKNNKPKGTIKQPTPQS